MIYIAVPEGWIFTKANEVDNKDLLVDESGRQIDIQDIIKTYLRTRNRHHPSLNVQDESTYGVKVTLYFRWPPNTNSQFLMYKPNNNGKLASEHTKIIIGHDKQIKHTTFSHIESLWYKQVPLTQEKYERFKEKYEQQKADRRHYGDSPKAT